VQATPNTVSAATASKALVGLAVEAICQRNAKEIAIAEMDGIERVNFLPIEARIVSPKYCRLNARNIEYDDVNPTANTPRFTIKMVETSNDVPTVSWMVV
jgi:hypothetical protein